VCLEQKLVEAAGSVLRRRAKVGWRQRPICYKVRIPAAEARLDIHKHARKPDDVFGIERKRRAPAGAVRDLVNLVARDRARENE
jgi:hypothetical protein